MLKRLLGGCCLVLKTALKTSVVPSRFCKQTMLLIALVAWTHQPEMRHTSVIQEHLHNLSMYSLYSMIAVSTMNWHSILYLITPWQYQQRLGILFYILSSLGNICLGLAFYFISGSALAFSLAEAWHSILYLITPWHYQPRLGMLFHILSRLAVSSEAISYHHALVLGVYGRGYILSRLGSICRGLACYSIS